MNSDYELLESKVNNLAKEFGLRNFNSPQLLSGYLNPDRYYHNAKHVLHCLKEFDKVRRLAQNPFALEMGLFAHDSVYDSRRNDNELMSINLLEAVLLEAQSPPEEIKLSERIVQVTDHKTVPLTLDEMLAVDIDLAIFGQSQEVFDEHEANIRKEYSWVLPEQFNEGRKKVLEYFLNRKSIYYTSYFREKYQKQAEENLKRSIAKLE